MANQPITNRSQTLAAKGKSNSVRVKREYKELVNGRNVNIVTSSEYRGKLCTTTTNSETTIKSSNRSISSSGKTLCDAKVQKRVESKKSAVVKSSKKLERREFSVSSPERFVGREKRVGGSQAVKLPLPYVNDQYGSAPPLCSKLAHASKIKTDSFGSITNNNRRTQTSVANVIIDKDMCGGRRRCGGEKVKKDAKKSCLSAPSIRILKRQYAVRVSSTDSEQSSPMSPIVLKKESLPLIQCKVQESNKQCASTNTRKMVKPRETNNNSSAGNCCNAAVTTSQVKTETKKPIVRKSLPFLSPRKLGRAAVVNQKKPNLLPTPATVTTKKVHVNTIVSASQDKQRNVVESVIKKTCTQSSSTPLITTAAVEATKSDVIMEQQKGKQRSSISSRMPSNKVRKMINKFEERSRKKSLTIINPMASYMQVCEGSVLELTVHIEGATEVVWVKDTTIVQNFPPNFVCVKEIIPESSTEIFKLKIADVFVEDSGIYICEAYSVERDDDVICWCKVDVIAMDPECPLAYSLGDKTITPQFQPASLPNVNTEVLEVCQEQALDSSTHDLSDECKELKLPVQVQVATISSQCLSTENEVDIVENDVEKVTADATRAGERDDSAEEEDNQDSSTAEVLTAQESCLAQEISVTGRREECIPLERNQILSILPAQVPKIVMGPSNLIALLGETIHLRVKMQCFELANTVVTWSKFCNGNYKVISSNTNDQAVGNCTKVAITTNNEITTLTMENITYDDSGKYVVTIENSAGKDYHVCMLTVEGPPQPPSSPPDVKYNATTNTILVAWSGSPYDGGSAVTGYYVEVFIQSSTERNNEVIEETWTLLTPQSCNWLCYTVANPTPNSFYRFRIRAENAYGNGKPTSSSEELQVLTGTESSSSYRSGSRHSSLHNFCSQSEGDEEDQSESDSNLKDYKNVEIKCEPFLDHYEKHEELGKGRFGVVFRVVQKTSGESFAGKFIKCIKGKDKERVHLEFNIMNDLKYHPKLLCLIDGFEMSREIVIVTERINGGELFERVVADDFTLTEHDCIDFLRQICAGVEYIHMRNIMHLDLKPENILCTTKTSNQIKIIDFGLAQYYNPADPIRVLFGTAEFVSPEIINYDIICPSTDMWSIGVITYILLSGLSPFMGDNDSETFGNITSAEFDFDDDSFDNVSEDAKDFISSLIIKREEKRLTAKECLDHKWLNQCNDIERKDIIISTDKLKRFLVRRKWQKTGNAIRALGRITTLYSSRRSSSASSTTSAPNYSPLMRSFSTQESTDSDVFINTATFTTPLSPLARSPCKEKSISSIHEGVAAEDESLCMTKTARYNESCRSDSGICDVVFP